MGNMLPVTFSFRFQWGAITMHVNVLFFTHDMNEVVPNSVINLTGTLVTVVEMRDEFELRAYTTLQFLDSLTNVVNLHLVKYYLEQGNDCMNLAGEKLKRHRVGIADDDFHNHSFPLMNSRSRGNW